MSELSETGCAAAEELDCPVWARRCGWVMTGMGVGAGAGAVIEGVVSGDPTPYMGIGMLIGALIGWCGYRLGDNRQDC